MDRRTAQAIYLFDSSVLGIAADAIARGFDAGAVMSDLVLSINSHDVIDVGSDLVNSEIMNSFLNASRRRGPSARRTSTRSSTPTSASPASAGP